MSAAGYRYDNAFAESAFASRKSERLDAGAPFVSKATATIAVFAYLETFTTANAATAPPATTPKKPSSIVTFKTSTHRYPNPPIAALNTPTFSRENQ